MPPEPTWAWLYYRRLTEIFKFLVSPGQKVLEIGCGRGDLLAALDPSPGLGVDFSSEMIHLAQARHPQLTFIHGDAHELDLAETFDVIIMSDLVNDLWDVQEVFRNAARVAEPDARLIINTYSRLWEIPLSIAAKMGMTRPRVNYNWLTVEDIYNLLALEDFEPIRHWSEILCPLDVPVVERFCNRFLAKLWPFRHAALTNFVVARPMRSSLLVEPQPLVSVIVPARNEAGNISEIFKRLPEMGRGTELVLVEGHSTDNTLAAIKNAAAKFPERRSKILVQEGEGKGDAVRLGFSGAEGDILIILDADLTVLPEDLPRFYEALVSGKGEFINGVRLVYPMEDRAMRFFNLVANKFFGLAFSWLLGQPVKDTLCGTKALWKRRYESIAANRSYFGYLDPFGDFDLIFGAAKMNLKILDMPIRYGQRTYGTTNIRRWSHGLLLLRMLVLAARRLKFV